MSVGKFVAARWDISGVSGISFGRSSGCCGRFDYTVALWFTQAARFFADRNSSHEQVASVTSGGAAPLLVWGVLKRFKNREGRQKSLRKAR
jgi:hypothetical protein